MKLNKILGIGIVAALGCTMTACDDETYDVVGNPANLVYMNIAHDYPANMPKNTFAYTLFQTPVGSIVSETPGDVDIYVMSSKTSASDIEVTLAIDPEAEIAGYSKIPAAAGFKATLAENKVTIPAGSNRSNSVRVNIDDANVDWSLLTDAAYVLPIKIVSANGATASQEKPYAYIGINVEKKEGMLNTDATSIPGTKIDPSNFSGNWSCKAYAGTEDEGGDFGSSAWDGSQWSYPFFVSNHADGVNEEVVMNFDLGQVYKLSGFRLTYYYNWYTIKDCTLETSVDGSEYINQGTATWDDNGINRNIAFWAPFDVRYIRVTTHSCYGGTGEGTAFGDFAAFEN